MRTLTFLFADLREYTAFVERHGDVAATTLIADYQRLVRAEVAKAKGAEVKTEGDSFYVVFDGAGDAVRCAVSILREADRYSRERPDRPMRVGIGIHAGEPQPHEGQYVGGAVIVAARLAQASGGGELLISDVVRGLLPKGTAPAVQERQGLVLKGIADAPRAFAVSWVAAEPVAAEPRVHAVEAAAPTDRSMLCPRVIGRDSELAALRALLGEAAAGQGRTVLIAGEAGVGKSAVLRAFLGQAAAANARVLRGECSEVEARRPFGPFIDAFVAASLPVPSELSQVGPGAMAVAEVERYRVHGAFAQALGELAESASVVIAIEDVHWADSATLELIPYLARKLRERRILLLYTYRDDEMHRLHPLRGTLADLKRLRLASEIHLARLTADEVAAMIQETMGLGRAPTTAFREAITERCEGNPFFIEEVLRTLVEKGDLEYREGAWRRTKEVSDLALPDSVRDAVQQRLGTLTPDARRILQIAAVIGQRFAFDLLQRVSGTSEASLLHTVREAMEAQLVIEEPDGGEEAYRFRHALTRESVLAELMRRERRLLHQQIAEAVESSTTDPEHRAEELAYHFDRGGDEDRAYRYHDAAARQAERVFAYARAMEHLERAIELAPPARPEVARLQLRLALVAVGALDNTRAVRAADAARASFRAAGDARGEGEALSWLGMLKRLTGQQTTGNADVARSVALLEPLGPSAELATALANSAHAAALDQEPESAIPTAQRAVEIATAVGAKEARFLALLALGTAQGMEGRPEEGIRTLRDLIRSASDESPLTAQRAHQNLSALLFWHGAPTTELDVLFDERLAHAKQHSLRFDGIFSGLAMRMWSRGEWDDALKVIEDGRGEAYFAPGREAMEAFIVAAREGPHIGIPKIEAAFRGRTDLRAPQDIVGKAGWMTIIRWLAGDHAGALREAAPLAEHATLHPAVDSGAITAMASAMELGDDDGTRRWAAFAAARATHFGHGWGECSRAFAEAVSAELAADLDAALQRYTAAAEMLEEHRQHVLSTKARLRRASILAQRGEQAAARADLETVVQFWRKAKATWYLGQLREWAAKRGIELPEAETAAAT